MAILNENEYVDVEGRGYINPQVALDEANSFIDNLRSTQQANNQQIQADTYNLGTEISSNLGGLTSPVGPNGAGDAGLSYFTSRYQTPQTNAVVADLRSTAQAQALNEVLANEQAKWKKRYQDTYRNYQKRASSGGGGTTIPGQSEITIDGGVEEQEVPENDSVASVSRYETPKDPVMDFIQGKGDWTIAYTDNGRTYYGNVYYQTGVSGDRYTGIDTSTGMSYSGQNALNYLNNIVSKGGKIYGPDGQEVTPQQALTGAPGRW